MMDDDKTGSRGAALMGFVARARASHPGLLHLDNVVCTRTQEAQVPDGYVKATSGNAVALVSYLQDSLRNV